VPLFVEENSPGEIALQTRLQIAFTPSTLQVFFALCGVAPIEAALPIY